MAEVKLILTADNTQYVNSIKQAQKETQKLADTGIDASKKRLGFIEQEEKRIAHLTELRRKAYDTSKIEFYNKTIGDSKKRLQEYEQLGTKAIKSTESLAQSIGKWALSLGGAAAIVGVLKEALMKMSVAINTVNIAGAVYNQVLHNIVTGQTSWLTGIYESIKVQQKLNDLRLEGYRESYEVQKLNTEFQNKWYESLDGELSIKERLVKINEAIAAKEEAVALQRDHAQKEFLANQEKVLLQAGNEENIKAMWESAREIQAIDAELAQSTKRLKRQREALEKEEHDKKIELWHKEIDEQNKIYDEQLKRQEAYQQKAKDLIDKYAQSNIDSLKGKEKLIAQRNFGVAQIKEIRDELIKLGPITPEQYSMLQKMADNVWVAYYEGLAKAADSGEIKLSKKDKDAISKGLIGGGLDLKGLQKTTLSDQEIKNIHDAFAGKGKPQTIWTMLGIDIDTEEGKKQQEELLKAKDTVIGVIDEINQKRVDDAQRRRELLDTQISETQQELETEVQLYQSGYASNVAAKKKELEELKRQRAIALKQEEDAVKRQRQMDTITQVSSLITASAQTFKAFPGPLLPVAIAVIAAMFAAFAISKVRAAEATKLAKGGSGTDTGIITGKSHAKGGERFLSQVEVERGEAWGVLSIPATQKYGKVFHHMVTSFNRGEVPVMPVNKINNRVLVENSGPNSRLDQVIAEQKQLNKKLSTDSVQDFGNVRVIRKGSTVRIINR